MNTAYCMVSIMELEARANVLYFVKTFEKKKEL